MIIKAVILDFGGTLADGRLEWEPYHEAIKIILMGKGYLFEMKEIKNALRAALGGLNRIRAQGKEMTFEEVDSVARGRVWTGRQALDRKLIDKLGGMDAAIDVIKEKAEIPAEDEVTFVHYPVKKSFVEALMAGELASAVKTSIVHQVRAYLFKWSMETEHGWYVMPYVVE